MAVDDFTEPSLEVSLPDILTQWDQRKDGSQRSLSRPGINSFNQWLPTTFPVTTNALRKIPY